MERAGPTARNIYLAELPERLAHAVGASELIAAVLPAPSGISVELERDSIWVGSRRLPSPLPRCVLHLDPPIDVRWLTEAWWILEPMAVSGDVHQTRWHIESRGPDLVDPFGPRFATFVPSAGRWEMTPWLTSRPVGVPSSGSAGASPSFDVIAAGGTVDSIVVSRGWMATDLEVAPDAPISGRSPRWARRHQSLDNRSAVVVRRAEVRLASASFVCDRDTLLVSDVCADDRDTTGRAGSALLDALEALALDAAASIVRLDRSVFDVAHRVAFGRHGYDSIGDGPDPPGVERRVTDP